MKMIFFYYVLKFVSVSARSLSDILDYLFMGSDPRRVPMKYWPMLYVIRHFTATLAGAIRSHHLEAYPFNGFGPTPMWVLSRINDHRNMYRDRVVNMHRIQTFNSKTN